MTMTKTKTKTKHIIQIFSTLALFAFLYFVPMTYAAPKEEKSDFQLTLGTSLNVGSASFAVKEAYDKDNYVGSFGGGLGIGGQALLFIPIQSGFQVGANFDWMYSAHTSTLYDISVFQPSAGPAIRWMLPNALDLIGYLNFPFGWVSSEGLTTCSKVLCPGGDFSVSMKGIVFGFRALYPINKSFSIGAFLSASNQTMNSVPYKFLENSTGKYRTLEADIPVSYSQVGVSVVWYPF